MVFDKEHANTVLLRVSLCALNAGRTATLAIPSLFRVRCSHGKITTHFRIMELHTKWHTFGKEQAVFLFRETCQFCIRQTL